MRRRIMAMLSCTAAVLSLTACTPVGKAVGDTQEHKPAVAHDLVHPTDVTVGFVGSTDTDVDRMAIDAIADDGLEVAYAALDAEATASDNDAASADAESTATAQNAVNDFTDRAVKLVIISGMNVTTANQQSWQDTLASPRNAGIPVILLNPVSTPNDELLYAATFVINDRDASATPLADAIMTIIRDDPHGRTIAVTAL
ncbi:hypothetical protein [Bifidobacterium scaligerum]|uniref:Sugar ABC transporter substrate-binding protein n=1 Tax=Bifidobacterium scaligerum TaxID=2052656 RepID=A0A2M9HSC1_9BIFI|nr:hypothetical protein [Bifidobacterium scaligerum]PJM79689.1 hypothetical protein CUU80_00590 [Bifidobacterium scaligerum]